MRTGTGPCGPGAASSRVGTSGGCDPHVSYRRICARPAGVLYASRIEVSPSSSGKRAATSGWTGIRLRALLQRPQQRVLAAHLVAAAPRLPAPLVLAGQVAGPAVVLERADDVGP